MDLMQSDTSVTEATSLNSSSPLPVCDSSPQKNIEIDIMDGWREPNIMRYYIHKKPDFDDSDDSDDGFYGEKRVKPPSSNKESRQEFSCTSDEEENEMHVLKKARLNLSRSDNCGSHPLNSRDDHHQGISGVEFRLQELNRLFQEQVQTDLNEQEQVEIERIKNDPNLLPEELEEILEMRHEMGAIVRRDDSKKQYDVKNLRHHHICQISDILKSRKHQNADMSEVWLLPGQTGKLNQLHSEPNKFLQQEAIRKVVICGIIVETWIDDTQHYLNVDDGTGRILCISTIVPNDEQEQLRQRLISKAERYHTYKKDNKDNPTESNRKAEEFTCLCMELETRKIQMMEIKAELPNRTQTEPFGYCTSRACCNKQYVLVYGLIVKSDFLGKHLLVDQQKLISLYTAQAFRSMLMARQKY